MKFFGFHTKPDMPKKPQKRSGAQWTVRCNDSDATRFTDAAREEGFDSVQQWLLEQGRARATVIEAAIADNRFIRVRGKLIPLSDFPDGKPPKG